MKSQSLFLENIIGDTAIFESTDQGDDSIYSIYKITADKFLVGYYYDIHVHEDGKYVLCINDEKIVNADVTINLNTTEKMVNYARNRYRDLRLCSKFFSDLYHANIDENIVKWHNFLENIRCIIHGNRCKYEKEQKDNLMYNIADVVRERLTGLITGGEYESEYIYIPTIKILLDIENVDKKRASIIMHALNREKFMVYNKDCENFLNKLILR